MSEVKFAPRGNKKPLPDRRDYVKGFSSPIPYVVRNETGDWDTDYMIYQQQRFKFDSNSCWDISGNNIVEDQMDFLLRRGSFPDETVKWFRDNGYINDEDCFQLSWRFVYAISGVYENGNSQKEFWRIIKKYGILPQKDFDFTNDDSLKFNSQKEMCREIGNKSLITKEMYDKAKESLKYIDIQYEWIFPPYQQPDDVALKAALLQAPVQIGVPACADTWNNTFVGKCSRKSSDHAVELLKVNDDGTKLIYDQYRPQEKTLPKDYLILLTTLGIISPIIKTTDIPNVKPFIQGKFARIWQAVVEWFRYNIDY